MAFINTLLCYSDYHLDYYVSSAERINTKSPPLRPSKPLSQFARSSRLPTTRPTRPHQAQTRNMAAAKIKLAALGTGIWYASKSFNNRCGLFPSYSSRANHFGRAALPQRVAMPLVATASSAIPTVTISRCMDRRRSGRRIGLLLRRARSRHHRHMYDSSCEESRSAFGTVLHDIGLALLLECDEYE
jgi:hypothetical protein